MQQKGAILASRDFDWQTCNIPNHRYFETLQYTFESQIQPVSLKVSACTLISGLATRPFCNQESKSSVIEDRRLFQFFPQTVERKQLRRK